LRRPVSEGCAGQAPGPQVVGLEHVAVGRDDPHGGSLPCVRHCVSTVAKELERDACEAAGGAAMTPTARAAVLEAPRRLVTRSFPLPEIGDDDGLLRVEACGLCGTDHEQYTGHLPAGF